MFLRGGDKILLGKIQRLVQSSILLAYHLRLETAFYLDRCVLFSADINPGFVDSDEEASLELAIAPTADRQLLSSSLDIDYIAPVPGITLVGPEDTKSFSPNCELLVSQSIVSMCFTRLRLTDGAQRHIAEHKHLTFYCEGDVCVGRYLIDQCFLPYWAPGLTPSTSYSRSFVHNPGRVEISVQNMSGDRLRQIPSHLLYTVPITLCSFCKICKCKVTPDNALSDEAWGMSFGKLLDLLLYNRTAQGSPFGCIHRCRENHSLLFTWAGLTAKMEFIPIHPFSIKVRDQLPLSEPFHKQQTKTAIEHLLSKSSDLFEEFRSAIARAEAVCREIIDSDKYPADQGLQLLELVNALDLEQSSAMDTFQDSLRSSLNAVGELTEAPVYLHFPMGWQRDLYILCDVWNSQLESIANRFEQLKIKSEQFSLFKSWVENEDRHPSLPSSFSESTSLGEIDNRERHNIDSSVHNDAEIDSKTESDKQSSISMVLALLVGSDTREKRRRIHLGDVADPSLKLLPGRRGEVILVKPEEPSSVVAYSLSSKEYFEQLHMYKSSIHDTIDNSLVQSRSEDQFLGRVSPGWMKSEDLRHGKSEETAIDMKPDSYDDPPPEDSETIESPQSEQVEVPLSEPQFYRPTPVYHQAADFSYSFLDKPRKSSDIVSDTIEDPVDEASIQISMEKQMVHPRKSHVKHHFEDSNGSKTLKFYCYSFWTTQFEILRRVYLGDTSDEGYIRSLASSVQWITQGGKSGASFAKSIDGRFVMKVISRTELLMFNDFAPAYFEYMSKALFHSLPSSLCKVMDGNFALKQA